VGLGSKLVSRAMLENRDYAGITAEASKALALVSQYRA
jgi:2-keto-3-deoxy-6-phosphogluconate aldolase